MSSLCSLVLSEVPKSISRDTILSSIKELTSPSDVTSISEVLNGKERTLRQTTSYVVVLKYGARGINFK